MFQHVDKAFATSNYHWFFLIQPSPLPETLIGNSAEFFLRGRFAGLIPQAITPEAYAEYLRCFKNPGTIHASCEDYRAGASIDLEHDTADRARKIACPVLALWAEGGKHRADVRRHRHLAGARRHESDRQGTPRSAFPSGGGARTDTGSVAGFPERMSNRRPQ